MITTHNRKSAARAAATAALALTAMFGMVGAAQAVEEQPPDPPGENFGCPYGAVCIYPDAGWNDNSPSHVFWSYGSHKIYNQFGKHRVLNNQYGGASAAVCKGANGTNCTKSIPETYVYDINLTPINSITLTS